MPRHDQVAAVAELNVRNADPLIRQAFHFLHQTDRVHNHAVADHARRAFTQDPGGYQVEDQFPVFRFHGMSCIVPALKTDHHLGVTRQNVNDLAFTFIAPLDANKH